LWPLSTPPASATTWIPASGARSRSGRVNDRAAFNGWFDISLADPSCARSGLFDFSESDTTPAFPFRFDTEDPQDSAPVATAAQRPGRIAAERTRRWDDLEPHRTRAPAGREVVAATPTPSVPKALPRRSPKNTLPAARCSLTCNHKTIARSATFRVSYSTQSQIELGWRSPRATQALPEPASRTHMDPLKTTMLNRKKPEEKPKIPLKSASHKLYYVNYEIGPTQPAPGSSVFEPEGPRFPLLRLISSQRVSPILAVRVRS